MFVVERFFVYGLDDVCNLLKRVYRRFPKETPKLSFTAIVPTIAVKEVFAQLFSKKRVFSFSRCISYQGILRNRGGDGNSELHHGMRNGVYFRAVFVEYF